jgi:hypothetical protein
LLDAIGEIWEDLELLQPSGQETDRTGG